MSKVLAIVGSRGFKDYELLKKEADRLLENYSISRIITGCARGADRLAVKYAEEHGIPCEVFEAEWDKYKLGAGPIRNAIVVKNCDILLAFRDAKSRGTRDTIRKAEKAGKKVIIVEI